MKSSKRPSRWIWLFVFLPLSGCEMTQNLPYVGNGLPEAESKAIGAGCRHAGRAIEDCYAINPRASRSGVFAGWREMNDYMASNKIAEVKPLVAANTPPPPPVPHADPHDADEETDPHADEEKGGKKDGVAVVPGGGHLADKTEKAGKDGKGGKLAKAERPAKADKADKGDPAEHEVSPAGGKGQEKASAKYVSSADRPPPPPKAAPRPRWEPGKKDKDDGEEAPRVWERKPRT